MDICCNPCKLLIESIRLIISGGYYEELGIIDEGKEDLFECFVESSWVFLVLENPLFIFLKFPSKDNYKLKRPSNISLSTKLVVS